MDIYASSREVGIRPRGPGQVDKHDDDYDDRDHNDDDDPDDKSKLMELFFAGPEPPDNLQHGVSNWVAEHKISNQDHCWRARLTFATSIFVLHLVSEVIV